MNKILQRVMVGGLCLGVLTTCTDELPIKSYPPFEKKLVMNGAVSTLKGVEIELSELLNPAEETVLPTAFIDDASIILLEEGKVLDTLEASGAGRYRLSQERSIERGHTYVIEAHAAGFRSVKAEVWIPEELEWVSARYLGRPDDLDRYQSRLKFELSYETKESTDVSFFALKVETYRTHETSDVNGHDSQFNSFFCNAVIAGSDTFFDNSCHGPSLKKKTDLLVLQALKYDSKNREWEPVSNTFNFFLSQISEQYWQFAENQFTYPVGTELLFADHQQTPSNVENGYGLVVGKNEYEVKVYLR